MSELGPTIRFDAFFTKEGSGSATLRFEIADERNEHVGYLHMDAEPTGHGTTDGMLAATHRRLATIARRWAGELDQTAVGYESR